MEQSPLQSENQAQQFLSNLYQKFKNWAFVTMPGSDPLVRSYLFLRSGIGIIGLALPVVLVIGTVILSGQFAVSDSLSSYYYTVTGGVFVGSLWAIGIFLITYKYDPLDNIICNIAGGCAILLSLFPTPPDTGGSASQDQIGKFHFLFATGFLLSLAIMAFLFTRGNPDQSAMTPADIKQKQIKNRVYVGCGIAMIACILIAGLILWISNPSNDQWHHQYHPILITEFIATVAFGVAWFVKGQTLSMMLSAVRRNPPSQQPDPADSSHTPMAPLPSTE